LDKDAITRNAEALITKYGIMTPSPTSPGKLLSGGNIQKLILARELSGDPRLVIAVHPTYGLDVGATEQIRGLILGQRSRGAAVLLVSEDLDEVLALSDRIAVIFEGQLVGIVDSARAEDYKIGLMMAGEAVGE
jgi:ABC-type uncharacterized transport system ATPase subunit